MAEVEELRVQPQDILAEQSVLGAIFIDESKLRWLDVITSHTVSLTSPDTKARWFTADLHQAMH